MCMLDFGSIAAGLSIGEWFVWAAIALLFGKQALVFAVVAAKIMLRCFAIAFATLAAALLVLGTITLSLALAIH